MNSANQKSKTWVIGITGASGTVYARRLIQALLEGEEEVKLEVIVSEAAFRVMKEEENENPRIGKMSVKDLIGFESELVTIHSNKNIGAPIASGSYLTDGMVIVPCSMKTLAAVACGYCDNLIQRAADVQIKEGRKLIIVPRETPLSRIHLENMLKLAQIGVAIVPAMPGFYHEPKTISDIVDLMVMKITDQMGYRLDLTKRWGEKKELAAGGK